MFEIDPEKAAVDGMLSRVREFVHRKDDKQALQVVENAVDEWMRKDFPSRPKRLQLFFSTFTEALPDDRMSADFLSGVLEIARPWQPASDHAALQARVHTALASSRPAA